MKRILLLIPLCVRLCAQTTVTSTLVDSLGRSPSGSVQIALATACHFGSDYVSPTTVSVPFSSGSFSVSLVPNETCVVSGPAPSGAWSSATAYSAGVSITYNNQAWLALAASTDVPPGSNAAVWGLQSTNYNVTWTLDSRQSWTEQWIVPASMTPVTVDSVRVAQTGEPNIVAGLLALGGDLNGTFGAALVEGIQGRPVSATARASGQGLGWNGTEWIPTTFSGGGGGNIASVFGRTGAITAQSGDYNTSQVTENTNLYYTGARATAAALAAVSATAPLSYNSSTGVFSCSTCTAGAISTVFGRTGSITAQSGDYSFSLISGSLSNTQLQAAVSVTTSVTSPEFCIGISCITSWPSGAIASVFGRTGAVTAQTGDYTAAQITGAEQTANKGAASGYAGLDASAYLMAVNQPPFTGDVNKPAGGVATTVTGINSTHLASLATGLLMNTNVTGVPTIAADGVNYVSPTTLNNATLSANLTTAQTAGNGTFGGNIYVGAIGVQGAWHPHDTLGVDHPVLALTTGISIDLANSASIVAASNMTLTGYLTVGGTLGVTGTLTGAASSFTNMTLSGTLGVTGAIAGTSETLTGALAGTSETLTGNLTAAGTVLALALGAGPAPGPAIGGSSSAYIALHQTYTAPTPTPGAAFIHADLNTGSLQVSSCNANYSTCPPAMPLGFAWNGNAGGGTVAGGATSYLGLGNAAPGISIANVAWYAPQACVLRNLSVYLTGAQPSDAGMAIQVYDDGGTAPGTLGTATGLTITVATSQAAGVYGQDSIYNTYAVAAGDWLVVQLVNSSASASATIAGYGLACTPY